LNQIDCDLASEDCSFSATIRRLESENRILQDQKDHKKTQLTQSEEQNHVWESEVSQLNKELETIKVSEMQLCTRLREMEQNFEESLQMLGAHFKSEFRELSRSMGNKPS
jgi:uncharacterized protein (DUF3084 family)